MDHEGSLTFCSTKLRASGVSETKKYPEAPPIAFWKGMNKQHLLITCATKSSLQGMAPSAEVASITA